MSIVGNIRCIKNQTKHCDCPSCRIGKPKATRLRLTRKDVELVAEILETHSLESHRKHLQKSEFSNEHLALLRLSRDVEDVAEKLRAALA